MLLLRRPCVMGNICPSFILFYYNFFFFSLGVATAVGFFLSPNPSRVDLLLAPSCWLGSAATFLAARGRGRVKKYITYFYFRASIYHLSICYCIHALNARLRPAVGADSQRLGIELASASHSHPVRLRPMEIRPQMGAVRCRAGRPEGDVGQGRGR